MLAKINKLLSGVPATLVGGIFLILSFTFPRIGIRLPADPAWITVIICGIPLAYLSGWRIVHNPGISKISSALLITIAMVGAIIIGDLFAAGEVAFIMALGAILEDMITGRAKKGLKKLLDLAPAQARRITPKGEEMIPAQDVRAGDVLRVLPGEAIPADGTILSGESSVDQAIMTGESLPVDKVPGESVFCGTQNLYGSMDITVTQTGDNSSLQKMIRLVEQAENKKAPMARIADVAATWLVPLVCLIALITGFATADAVRAVTVLVVFCPCALVLSTPTAIMAAIGQATKKGVIIKSGEALEKMGQVDTIAFDKTGTLTEGTLGVSDIISADDTLTEDALLAMAASAEQKSEHPLGKAIYACAVSRNLTLSDAESFRMTAGKGIYAVIDGSALLCGTARYLEEQGVILEDKVLNALEQVQNQGKASVLVAKDKKCMGILALSDCIRKEAGAVIQNLNAMNTDTLLLTGDNKNAAQTLCDKLGITRLKAQLLPEEKVAAIENLQKEGRQVCMIGDGVNDAPALKTAHVGIAMGAMGSDIAVEAADITLMSDDIEKLPYLKKLSNATVNTIRLSITLSMCINLCAVTLSIAGILNPTTGALVHNVGSCLVVLIAACLYDRKFD